MAEATRLYWPAPVGAGGMSVGYGLGQEVSNTTPPIFAARLTCMER
jgi:hypothetical protein